jgi:hypothetical protein
MSPASVPFRESAVSRAPRGGWTRRQVLGASGGGLAVLAVAGTAGLDLVSRGVLPGQQVLDRLDGACSVARPPMIFSAPGPAVSGSFFSRARRRVVGYTIAWRLHRGRRRHPRLRAGRDPCSGGMRAQRPVPPRSARVRPSAAWCRGGHLAWLPRCPVLHRPGTAVAGLPGPPPHRGLVCPYEYFAVVPRGDSRGCRGAP